MKKIKNMFGGSKKDGNVVERTTPPGQDSEARLDEDANRQKDRGSEIAFGGRLGDFVSPTGDDAVEEEDIAENPIAQDNNASDDPLLQAAILEHCEALGIDPKKHPEFVYIAKESLLAPVPNGWKEHRHEDGNPFYVNLETGVSQWDHPSDKYYSKKFKKLLKKKNDDMAKKSNTDKQATKSKIKKGKGAKIDKSGMNIMEKASGSNKKKVSKAKEPQKPKREEEDEDPFLKQAILEQCSVLGIDPKKHPEYVYIAKESLLAPVPEGWEERDKDGDPFYLHVESGKTQWEHPEDETYRLKFQELLRKRKTETSKANSKGQNGMEENDTWDDWDEIEDQDSTKPTVEKINVAENPASSLEKNVGKSGGAQTAEDTVGAGNNDGIMEDWDDESDDDTSEPKQIRSDEENNLAKNVEEHQGSNKATSKSQPSILESAAFPLESSGTDKEKVFQTANSDEDDTSNLTEVDAKQIFQMESSMRLLKSENEELRTRLVNLDVESRSTSNMQQKNIDQLQEQMDILRDESDKIKIENDEIKRKLSIREDRMSTMKAENNILKQSIEKLESSKSDLEQSLSRSNKDQDVELANVKNKIDLLMKEKVSLKKELDEAKFSYEKLNSSTTRRVQTSMQTARNAQTARKKAEDQLKELEKKLQQSLDEKNSATRALESEVKSAIKRAREAESARSLAVSGAKKKYDFNNQKIEDYEKKLEDASRNLLSKSSRIKELQHKVKTLEAENTELSKKIKTLEATNEKKTAEAQQKLEASKSVNVDLYTSEIVRLKTELAASERRVRDAERLASKAEERADRAESSHTESAVENELATSLGIKVYELEREKEKLESLIRDAGTDKDLYKAQAEAALRERSQVLDRIKVEQKRNDELVSQRQRQSEEKISLVAQLEQSKLSEERLKKNITALREESEAIRKQMNKQNNASSDSTVKVLAAVREERERLKSKHDEAIAALRKELLEAKNIDGLNTSAEYKGKFIALEEEIRLLKVENSALKSMERNHDTPVSDAVENNIPNNTITDSPQSEKEASLAAQLQDVVRQSAATISTHIQEISSLRSRIASLQEENSRLKISASEDLETWKRRATEAMAEAEALRIERNERRVDMKELREEWKALHKELRDVKVQEMVARESAIRAETKLEKYMGDTDSSATSRMSGFLQDMRNLVEQVASFQQRPHEALLDGSTSYALTDQELDSQSPQRMSRHAVERNTPVYKSSLTNHGHDHGNSSSNYPRAPEAMRVSARDMPPPLPTSANVSDQHNYASARRDIEALKRQLSQQRAQIDQLQR